MAPQVETFARNPAVAAAQDVATRTFADDIIAVVYQKDGSILRPRNRSPRVADRHVTACTRVFEKPQMNAKRVRMLDDSNDMLMG